MKCGCWDTRRRQIRSGQTTWETDRTLASQRATNVVIYVQEHSEVDPARLVSEGLVSGGPWPPMILSKGGLRTAVWK